MTTTRNIRSGATVTIQRAEVLEDDAAMTYVIVGGELRLVMYDQLITAKGRELLTELLTEVLNSHYRRVEPLRSV